MTDTQQIPDMLKPDAAMEENLAVIVIGRVQSSTLFIVGYLATAADSAPAA